MLLFILYVWEGMLEKLPGAPSCAVICSSAQASLGLALLQQTSSLCLIAVVPGGLSSCTPSTSAGSPEGRASFDPAEKKRAIITSKKRKQEKQRQILEQSCLKEILLHKYECNTFRNQPSWYLESSSNKAVGAATLFSMNFGDKALLWDTGKFYLPH